MPRKAAGGAFESRGKFFARVTDAPKHRTAVLVPTCKTLAEAEARAHEIQGLVDRLRESGHARGVASTIETAAAYDKGEMRTLAKLIDRVVAGKEPPPWDRHAMVANGETFEGFAMKWVKGELAELYPDHVERKRSAYTDLCILRKYVFPALTGRTIASITLADYEQVMREIAHRAGGRKLRSSTRRHVAQVMRRVMQLAEYPAKLIERNPIPANAMPRVRMEVALQYIYPDEDATLLACADVDLGRRVLYGFLARAGWRREEALGGKLDRVEDALEDGEQALDEVPPLTWRRLDVVHGVVQLDREKTGRPRPVPIDPDLVRALGAWRKLTPKPGDDDLVFVDVEDGSVERHRAARQLRADLIVAGVDRAELHDTASPLRKPVRLHDLRASMVTIGLANGRSEDWVRRRTGHTSSALERYRRVASTLREMTPGDWKPLDQAIPELSAIAAADGRLAAAETGNRRGENEDSSTIPPSRGERIRTSDPLTPSQVR